MRDQARWRHEWVPRNMAAAIIKAKGGRERARQLLDAARERRLARAAARGEAVFASPHPAHQAAVDDRRRLADLSDDQLADAMGDADDDELGRLVAELDRRDRAQRRREQQRERRAAARAARDEKRDGDYDDALAAGEDPEAAYARIWGVDEARVRQQQAAEALKSLGYAGKSFRERARAAHRHYVEDAYWHAEDECRGFMLNKAGVKARVHPRSLFTGPEARARKYASEDLLRYWHEKGRLTSDDVVAGLLGGAMRSTSTAAWS